MINTREEYQRYHQKLAEALAQLAKFKTPQEIANHLLSKGIRGDAGCFSTCPLAVFLSKEVGQPVMVGASFAGLSDNTFGGFGGLSDNTFGGFGGLSIQLPDVVAAFVTEVDDYEHQELIECVAEET